jgi:hypothetical protein
MVICWMKKGNNITYRSAIGSLTGSYIFVNARPGGPHIIKMQIVIVLWILLFQLTLAAPFVYICLHICSKAGLQVRFPNVNSMANICPEVQRKASR